MSGRRSIPKELRKKILMKQGGRCAGTINKYRCPLNNYKLRLDECQTDHIIEWALTKDNSIGNLQVLCHMCHAHKTLNFMRKHMKGKMHLSKKEKEFIRV